MTFSNRNDTASDDPFAYFRPGELVYLVQHENDSLTQAQIDELFRWSNSFAASLGLYILPPNQPPIEGEPGEPQEPNEPHGGGDQGPEEGPIYVKDDIALRATNQMEIHATRQEPEGVQEHQHRRARLYPFSRNTRNARSIAPPTGNVEGRSYTSPSVERPKPFTMIAADVIDQAKPRELVEGKRLVPLILLLDEHPERPALGNDASLDLVSPNWLMGASSESGGTGGPGSYPVPFTYVSGQPSARVVDGREVMDFPFDVLQNFGTVLPALNDERGMGVKVAILDTAPSLHELSAAYERWHKVDPARNRHLSNPLLEDLLRPGGPLTVHPASYNDLARMRSVHLREHNYNMTDHGLFVAGIIHRIAPTAELHLFEVLNPDGVGDLESIAKGLWEAFDQFAGEPLVVNCSLVFNIPFNGHEITALDPEILKRIVKDWETYTATEPQYLETSPEGAAWLRRQGEAIKWICDLLYSDGSRVIAAAGNDWKQTAKPNARFPAAFDSVFGVGALPKNIISSAVVSGRYPTARYSNIADEPGEVGVTTFGGEAGDKNGVLGLYIGEFPADPNPPWWRRILNFIILRLGGRVAGPPNLTDMAWWAGTSFAAPIVTGTLAAVLGGMVRGTSVEGAIRQAYRQQLIMEDCTDYHEDALDVIQQNIP